MKQTKGLCWKTVLSWHAVSSWKVVTYEDMLHDLWRCAVLSWPMKLTNLLSWPALLFDMMYSLWKLYYFEMLLHSNANRLFLCVISLIHTCGMTDSHVWHDEFTRVTWRIQTCDLIHSHVWHDWLTCVRLAQTMTRLFTRVTCLGHQRDSPWYVEKARNSTIFVDPRISKSRWIEYRADSSCGTLSFVGLFCKSLL